MSHISFAVFCLFFISQISSTVMALTNSLPDLDRAAQSEVFIRTNALTEDGDSAPALCNGTLVGADLVVTAAHCVVFAKALRDRSITIEVGKYKYVLRGGVGPLVRVGYAAYLQSLTTASFFVLPSLQAEIDERGIKTKISPDEDIAVIKFDKPLDLPADFQFTKLVSQINLPVVLENLEQFRYQVVSVNMWDEPTTDFKRYAPIDTLKWKGGGWFTSKSESRVEAGDSGSPLLVNIADQYQLLGVVKGRAETIAFNWDVFALASGQVCKIARANRLLWIDQKVLCR